MGFLSNLLGGRKPDTQTTSVDRPFRIPNPSIGFLNLQGPPGAALAEADRQVLSPLFKVAHVVADTIPKCEVLFVYCSVDGQGGVMGSPNGIRDLIKNAGAYVAVVATENRPDAYIRGMNTRNDWHANIALIIDRKGEKLALFFHRLFQEMFNGRSMLTAWVELAPQAPGRDHPDAPDSIMVAEAGHVTFGG